MINILKIVINCLIVIAKLMIKILPYKISLNPMYNVFKNFCEKILKFCDEFFNLAINIK